MDITKYCICSLGLLCHAFTVTAFSCWLFVGLSGFSNWKTLLSWDQVSDLAIKEYSISLPWKNVFDMFWAIIHLYYKTLSYQFWSIYLNLGKEYSHADFKVHPLTFISSHITSVPLAAIDAHVVTLPPI